MHTRCESGQFAEKFDGDEFYISGESPPKKIIDMNRAQPAAGVSVGTQFTL